MQFHWFVKLHNCARWGVCRSHIINRQYKTRTDAASAIQWALTTWNYSPCSWKVAFYSSAPGNGNKGCDIHWIKAFILKQRWQKGDIASIWTYLSVVNLRYKQNKPNMKRKKLGGEKNTGCMRIREKTEACDTSGFGLSKNHIGSKGAYIMLCRVVCSCMWAGSELIEQLWGRLQVKDESSPTGRHQSLMDWHIWEERQGETEGEPAENRQQTHSYTVELWPCWDVEESLLSRPAKPLEAHLKSIILEGRSRKWCNLWQGVGP